MREYYDYDQHRIELDLIEIRPARYRWLYMIDGERIGRNIDVLQDIGTARATALRLALREIDQMSDRASAERGPDFEEPDFARVEENLRRASLRAA